MKKFKLSLGITLAGLSIALMGCDKKKLEEELSAGIPFTSADIAKAWASNCTAKVDSTMGTQYYKVNLTLYSNGSFGYVEYAYTAPSGGTLCSNVDYINVYSVSGTWTLGGAVTGGQSLNFTTTTNSNLTVTGTGYTATQNKWNTDCGGTSPYCTLGGGTCTNNGKASGVGQNSSTMTCQNHTFPIIGTTLYNIASWDGSNFYIGAPTTGVPGVFNTGSTPSSATLYLHQ
jgi:hypothetical protein